MYTESQLAEFKKGMEALQFRNQDGTLIRSDRSRGYDNDCSDDERDDSFYEEKSIAFEKWSEPITTQVFALAKKHGITTKISGSAEYGDIYVNITE